MDTTINGAHFHGIAQGDPLGLPLVFVHGFPFSHAMWRPQLEALGPEFRCLAYDLRGFGASDPGDGIFTLEAHVDDLIALLDTQNIPRAVVIGLSMGGYIALRALQRNPERFRAAVLCDTRSEPDSDEAKLRRAAQVKQVKAGDVAGFAETMLQALFAAETLQNHPDRIDAIRQVILRTSPRSLAGNLLAMAARSDTTAALPGLKLPTLILVGEKDPITPPAAARVLHEKIPGSGLAVIPGAAHLSNLENPEVFNRHLMEFLRRVPRP